MDYPQDENLYRLQDEYMFGDSILVAPYTDLSGKRNVYLPKGSWYSFFTNQEYVGGVIEDYKDVNLPVFVKKDTIIPLAEPNNYLTEKAKYDLTIHVFGEKGSFTLFDKNIGEITISYENGQLKTIGDIDNSQHRIKEIIKR